VTRPVLHALGQARNQTTGIAMTISPRMMMTLFHVEGARHPTRIPIGHPWQPLENASNCNYSFSTGRSLAREPLLHPITTCPLLFPLALRTTVNGIDKWKIKSVRTVVKTGNRRTRSMLGNKSCSRNNVSESCVENGVRRNDDNEPAGIDGSSLACGVNMILRPFQRRQRCRHNNMDMTMANLLLWLLVHRQ